MRMLVAVLMLALAAPAGAATVRPGDLLVADGDAKAVIRVSPGTGEQEIVSQDDMLIEPMDLVQMSDGTILVADLAEAVIRVDPVTGQQSVLSDKDDGLTGPPGIALGPNEEILITEPDGDPAPAIYRVNPVFGFLDIVSSGGSLAIPYGIDVAPNGDIFVTDLGLEGVVLPAVYKITEADGQMLVSQGDLLQFPTAIAVRGDKLLVADPVAMAVIEIDPTTGAQTEVSAGGSFGFPAGIAVAADGTTFVSDGYEMDPAIYDVDPSTGDQTPVSAGGLLDFPTGITTVPEPGTSAVAIAALGALAATARSRRRGRRHGTAAAL